MNDILLGALILFSGFVPVTIALWYSNKLLKEAQELHKLARAIADQMPKNMADWLLGDDFGTHLKNIFNGVTGQKVQEVKKSLQMEGNISGLPAPVKNVIGKGVANFLSDYGLPKKGVADAISSLLNRRTPEQQAKNDAVVMQYMKDAGMDQMAPVQPIIPQYPE